MNVARNVVASVDFGERIDGDFITVAEDTQGNMIWSYDPVHFNVYWNENNKKNKSTWDDIDTDIWNLTPPDDKITAYLLVEWNRYEWNSGDQDR